MSMFNRVLHALERAEADLREILHWNQDTSRHRQTLRDLKKAIHIMEDAGFESDYEEQAYWDDENQLVEETNTG